VNDAYILGIESSCDETSAAVVRSGEQVLSNVVSSQVAVHQPYGGVVPELASREHLRNILPVVHRALEAAGRSYEEVDALAVTQGPGLAGALLVGVSFAKALSFALGKPLVAVNHLEGHIHAVLLEQKQSRGEGEIEFPVLALVVSGGHTHLFLAEAARPSQQGSYRDPSTPSLAVARDGAQGDRNGVTWRYRNVGRTRDDAAGEAFDKVAKLLGLGYPGGPVIDRLAKLGDPRAVKFTIATIKGPDRNLRAAAEQLKKKRTASPTLSELEAQGPTPSPPDTTFDFSFSGIKTAVLRYVETHGMAAAIAERRRVLASKPKATAEELAAICNRETLNLIASFQRAVVNDLVSKTLTAARELEIRTLFVTGGVAANSELRAAFEHAASEAGIGVYFPSRPLSTDNAAMIAAAAYPKFVAREFAPAEFSADAGLALR
jgi:N6-L-threonylcarbamoyladenine synthase